MLARLRENLSYKLLALLCACALRWYVDAQQNPIKTHDVHTTVVTRNLPTGMLIADQSSPTVTVTLEGPLEELSRLPENSVIVTADLSSVHTGRQSSVPVEAKLAPGIPGTVTISDTEPRTITLTLQPKRKRRMGIRVEPSGSAPEGYVFRKPDVAPVEATVIGGEDAVNRVFRLVVRPEVTGAGGVLEDDYQIRAIDDQKRPVDNVSLVPPTAHVRLGIIEATADKDLLVSPDITGVPAPGFKIADVQVNPARVPFTGRIDTLARVGVVSTAPIDITGAAQDVVKTVTLSPLRALSPVAAVQVTVTVHIVPVFTAPGPAIAPAPPAQP
ncbi:MAG: YbbR family protein [Capsulimonas sp.]|nr:YbbR family protein [Capsulimonas sp.]